jgi:putative acetyltransferase
MTHPERRENHQGAQDADKAGSAPAMKGANVQLDAGFEGHENSICNLFKQTFTASEGSDEGALIGNLVHDLLARTPAAELRVFRATDKGRLIGAVVFTRLIYPEDPRCVVLLSPMAVATDRQRQGIGQALIHHALTALRNQGVKVAITYGDPEFYHRVGFKAITEDEAQAPLPLSLPHGWIGQSLTDKEMPTLLGKPTCVPAMNRADIW